MNTGRMLSVLFLENHPGRAARILESLPLEQAAEFLETVPAAPAAGAMERMEPAWSVELLQRFSPGCAGRILEALPSESAVRLMLKLAPEERELALGHATRETAERLRRLLTYPEDSAGRLMDPMVLECTEDLDVAEAMRRLRRQSLQVRYYLYITDAAHRLVGVLSLRELMAAPRGERLTPRFLRAVIRLDVKDTRSTVLQHPGWIRYHSLPVTDASGVLVGVLRYETFRRLEGETATERPSDLIGLGSALGEAWIGMSALLFDGFAGSLHASRTTTAPGAKEAGDGS